MVKSVVVYFSGYGRTRLVAEAIAQGASAHVATVGQDGELDERDWTALDEADAIIFGAPTYMGTVPWQFKKFADASSKRWYARAWEGKVFGGFTNSASFNGDKQVTLIYLQTLASQHGGIWVSLGLLPGNVKVTESPDLNVLGGSVGLLVRSSADANIGDPSASDLETARVYGARITGIANRLKS
ncbi:flavodoxin family protein [Paraburkholderia caribensis]|uniref:flavodoxin family protein n=1 Tax=Paraburkholderia caribensis TaxID=75105 RepID=UPI0031D10C91